jgi:hypothetical protein
LQAEHYKQGALAGTVLAGYRYLVAVSRQALPSVPEDDTVGGVIYLHINIVVEPDTPSKAARAGKRP